jgi:hypothetical protein
VPPVEVNSPLAATKPRTPRNDFYGRELRLEILKYRDVLIGFALVIWTAISGSDERTSIPSSAREDVLVAPLMRLLKGQNSQSSSLKRVHSIWDTRSKRRTCPHTSS